MGHPLVFDHYLTRLASDLALSVPESVRSKFNQHVDLRLGGETDGLIVLGVGPEGLAAQRVDLGALLGALVSFARSCASSDILGAAGAVAALIALRVIPQDLPPVSVVLVAALAAAPNHSIEVSVLHEDVQRLGTQHGVAVSLPELETALAALLAGGVLRRVDQDVCLAETVVGGSLAEDS
jgi:hypothetical protein